MKIEVLYFRGCPNYAETVKRVRQVVQQLGLDTQVEQVEVTASDDPAALRFAGSPTVLVDGVDIDPAQRDDPTYSFSCRQYEGSGVPPIAMIIRALAPGDDSGQGRRVNRTARTDGSDLNDPPTTGYLYWTGMGAIGSAIGASACCWLPALVGAVGIPLAGAGAWFKATRPILLGAAGLMLAFGFYRTYFRGSYCEGDRACASSSQSSRSRRLGLWVTTTMVVAASLLPYYAPSLTHPFVGSSSAAVNSTTTEPTAGIEGSAQTFNVPISGMTCAKCAARLQRTLRRLPGVRAAVVAYRKEQATIFARGSRPGVTRLANAIRQAGFSIPDTCARACGASERISR